jgi:hypothetical protein
MKRTLDAGEVRKRWPASAGAEALLEAAARLLRRARAGDRLDDLSILGPIFVLKLRFTPRSSAAGSSAEMWIYPTVARARALDPRPRRRGVPGRGRGTGVPRQPGVDLSGEQETKTQEGARVLRGSAQERELSRRLGAPRWEWRAFGESFGGRRDALGELTRARGGERRLYLLSVASNESVKVRGGRLDLKRLQRVDEDGLEQWEPVMKAAFPVAAADLQSVLRHSRWNLAERDEYTLEQLLVELVDRGPS